MLYNFDMENKQTILAILYKVLTWTALYFIPSYILIQMTPIFSNVLGHSLSFYPLIIYLFIYFCTLLFLFINNLIKKKSGKAFEYLIILVILLFITYKFYLFALALNMAFNNMVG